MTYTNNVNESTASPLESSSASAAAAPSSVLQTLRAQSPASASSAAAAVADDSAKVSLAGAMLSQASTGSDVRFERVAALRQSIDSGSYTTPAATVAASLIQSLQR